MTFVLSTNSTFDTKSSYRVFANNFVKYIFIDAFNDATMKRRSERRETLRLSRDKYIQSRN